VLGAAGFFGQLQDALNTVWEVTPKPGGGILDMIKGRFLSFTMVLGIGFLLLVSLLISTVLANLTNVVGNMLPGADLLAQIINFVVSFLVVTLLFAMIYKVLPDAVIAWSDVWVGAAITALLFNIGKFLLGLYLGSSSIASTYGAAGSLVVLLVWVYYSAQILLFGAEFTQVYAQRFGSRIVPADNAVAVTEAQRAQEGAPHSGSTDAQVAADSPVSPVVVVVNETLPKRADPVNEMEIITAQPVPPPRQRWSLLLLGVAIYNTLVGGIVVIWSLMRPRPSESPPTRTSKSIFARRRG
jgi:hypothetical protein